MIDAPPAIHYVVQGDPQAAAPIVLLNGGMMTTFHWEPVAAKLRGKHRVILLDFRGQLQSPIAPEAPAPADLAGHARDVVAVLDQLGIKKAHLAGTSFGSLVALVMAAEYPDRVSSVVALNSTARLSPENVEGTKLLRRYAQEAVAGGDGGKVLDTIVPTTYSPEWIAANQEVLPLRRQQVAALPKGWFAGVDAILGALETMNLAPYLAKIRVPATPITIIAGEKDVTFPVPFSEELHKAIPGSQLVVVPGASHGYVLEHPDDAAARIESAVQIAIDMQKPIPMPLEKPPAKSAAAPPGDPL
ncbi:MAG TPA: alpha/beta hydrolase [Thermoanaerobaculia bacterium]|jgi:3-oxoadipate enol-lactonase|nr:alpha/beta hydrolase [Thermoanaerobaculia bacterium]